MNTFTRAVFLTASAALMTLTACDLRGRPSSDAEDITYLVDPARIAAADLSHERSRPGEATRRKSLPRWEVELFARTLLGECGRCSDAEVLAISRVILNRHESGRWGREIGDVVTFERNGTYAFSTWDPRQNKLEAVGAHVDRSPAFARMKELASRAWQTHRSTPDPTCGAVHFYHPSSMRPMGRVPRWAKGKRTKKIGSAVFVLGRAGGTGCGTTP